MATKTLGTNLTTTLTAIQFALGAGTGVGAAISAADLATMAAIKNDQGNLHELIAGSFTPEGRLVIPNRGVLTVLPGDWIGLDSRGWPILLSKDTIANGPWTHN